MEIIVLIITAGIVLSLIGLGFILWQAHQYRQANALALAGGPAAGVASPAPANGQPTAKADKKTKANQSPRADKIGPTEDLVDLLGLIGPALVLNNGTFVRMLEVAPVDLALVDPTVRDKFWGRFSDAMRQIKSPIAIQIVITTQPQDITPYLNNWETAAKGWRARAEATNEAHLQGRRQRMLQSTIETSAFLVAAHERLLPMQQRYYVVVSFNPFPEAQTSKKKELALSEKIATQALEKLDEHVALVKGALGRLALPIYDLDPVEMCQVIWEYYHHPPNVLGGGVAPQVTLADAVVPGSNGALESLKTDPSFLSATNYLNQRPSAEQILEAAANPGDLAYLLAPSLVDEQAGYIRVGNVVGRTYIMNDVDSATIVDMSSLLSFTGDVTHSLYLTPADPAALRQLLKEKETELKSGQMTDSRQGRVTDWGRQAMVEATESMRAELETAMKAPFFMHWFAVVWANDSASLEKKCQQFETMLKTKGIYFQHGTRVHQALYQSCRPLMRMAYKLKPRNMTAEALGPFFPFARREYFNPKGWHFGIHRGNGMFVCIDPFREGQDNASEMVLGTPGSGKSVYLKQNIETALALGHRVFVIDPEREYLRLAVDFHAPYIELGKRRPAPRIPFDPMKADAWLDSLVDVGHIFEALAARRLTEAETGVLADHYYVVMQAAGLRYDDPETWQKEPPTLAALVDSLAADPDGGELARVLDYTASALSGGNQINILDINLRSEDPWTAAAQSLAAFAEVVMRRELEPTQFNALIKCFKLTMERWGIREDDESTWTLPKPTLAALADVLANDVSPEAKYLASVFEQYAYGLYSKLFDCQTNVDIGSSQLVVFGIRSLRENVEKSLAPVFVWQVLQLVWNEIIGGNVRQPSHLLIDESYFVLEQPGAALRLERMGRSFRKHHARIVLATHEADKLATSPEAKAIADVASMVMLFGQKTENAVRGLARMFGLSDAEQTEVLRTGKGEGLLLSGTALRIPIYVAVNPLRLQVLSTNVQQLEAVARASGRRAEPVV